MERYKILIVEDEVKTGEYLQKALIKEGIDSDIADDGKKGIAFFQKNRYDLVLLDLKLPEFIGKMGRGSLEQKNLCDRQIKNYKIY